MENRQEKENPSKGFWSFDSSYWKLVIAMIFLGLFFGIGPFKRYKIGGKKSLPGNAFRFQYVKGMLVSDDYEIVNISREQLTNITIQITATDINGSKKTKSATFSMWNHNERKIIQTSKINGETVSNVRRIDVKITAQRHKCDFYIRY